MLLISVERYILIFIYSNKSIFQIIKGHKLECKSKSYTFKGKGLKVLWSLTLMPLSVSTTFQLYCGGQFY
jgi:hypothetical protein